MNTETIIASRKLLYDKWCNEITPMFYGKAMTNEQFIAIIHKIGEFIKENELEYLFEDILIKQRFTFGNGLNECWIEVFQNDRLNRAICVSNALDLNTMRMRVLYNMKLYF